jgi:hypothetical protein
MIVLKEMKEITTSDERTIGWRAFFPSEIRPGDLPNTSL